CSVGWPVARWMAEQRCPSGKERERLTIAVAPTRMTDWSPESGHEESAPGSRAASGCLIHVLPSIPRFVAPALIILPCIGLGPRRKPRHSREASGAAL